MNHLILNVGSYRVEFLKKWKFLNVLKCRANGKLMIYNNDVYTERKNIT